MRKRDIQFDEAFDEGQDDPRRRGGPDAEEHDEFCEPPRSTRNWPARYQAIRVGFLSRWLSAVS